MLKLLIATGVLLASAASAQAETLKILTTGAFKQVVLAMVPDYEARTGTKVDVINETTGVLIKRIDAGETFDVVFIPPQVLATLSGQGKVDAASVRPVARVAIGVAVKAGSPSPAIGTVEQFKKAVLDAHKVAYINPASGGSSGIYLEGLFQRLGLSDAVHAKAVLVNGGLVADHITNGEADFAIHQVSEILPVRGVTLVGLLPAEIQNYTVYGVGIAKNTSMAKAAASFVAEMNSPLFGDVIKAKGMEAVK
jgi:molybdate transport system substrate-binding protein